MFQKIYSPDISGAGHRRNDPRRNDPTKQDESDNDHTRITPEEEKPEKNDPETPQPTPGRKLAAEVNEEVEKETVRTGVRFGLAPRSSFNDDLLYL